MIAWWWLVVEGVILLLFSAYVQVVVWRTGVWDGAFNHFLPEVRRQIIFYDSHRAVALFRDWDGNEDWLREAEQAQDSLRASGNA